MAMRILLVDDHALFREALERVLRDLDRDLSVIHAGTAPESIAAVSFYKDLDLILLDRSLAGKDGISILPQLRDAANGTPIVLVSGSVRTSDVRRALQLGAASYVPKMVGVQELLLTLRRVLAGEEYLPTTLLASMAEPTENEITPSSQEHIDHLTVRQKEVLRLLSQGLSNKGIANRLDLCEGTVKLHVSAVMRTLGVRNRTEAVVVAEQFAQQTCSRMAPKFWRRIATGASRRSRQICSTPSCFVASTIHLVGGCCSWERRRLAGNGAAKMTALQGMAPIHWLPKRNKRQQLSPAPRSPCVSSVR